MSHYLVLARDDFLNGILKRREGEGREGGYKYLALPPTVCPTPWPVWVLLTCHKLSNIDFWSTLVAIYVSSEFGTRGGGWVGGEGLGREWGEGSGGGGTRDWRVGSGVAVCSCRVWSVATKKTMNDSLQRAIPAFDKPLSVSCRAVISFSNTNSNLWQSHQHTGVKFLLVLGVHI